MKKVFFVILVLFICRSVKAATITAINNGNWTTLSTWSCGCLPSASDNIVIPAGIDVLVTIPGAFMNAAGTQITITVNGILTINSTALAVNSNDIVRINSGGAIVAAGLGGSVFSGVTNVALSSGSSIVGPSTITNGTLPITLLYFRAEPVRQTVHLTWASGSEKNFDRYTIERSSDGENFAQIGNRVGAGTSVEEIAYEWTDENPMPDQSYYRLRAIDLDGSVATYNVARVNMGHAEKKCTVYPNPVTDKIVKFEINFAPAQNDFVAVRMMDGSVLIRSKFAFGKNEIRLPENSSPGVYIFEISAGIMHSKMRVILE